MLERYTGFSKLFLTGPIWGSNRYMNIELPQMGSVKNNLLNPLYNKQSSELWYQISRWKLLQLKKTNWSDFVKKNAEELDKLGIGAKDFRSVGQLVDYYNNLMNQQVDYSLETFETRKQRNSVSPQTRNTFLFGNTNKDDQSLKRSTSFQQQNDNLNFGSSQVNNIQTVQKFTNSADSKINTCDNPYPTENKENETQEQPGRVGVYANRNTHLTYLKDSATNVAVSKGEDLNLNSNSIRPTKSGTVIQGPSNHTVSAKEKSKGDYQRNIIAHWTYNKLKIKYFFEINAQTKSRSKHQLVRNCMMPVNAVVVSAKTVITDLEEPVLTPFDTLWQFLIVGNYISSHFECNNWCVTEVLFQQRTLGYFIFDDTNSRRLRLLSDNLLPTSTVVYSCAQLSMPTLNLVFVVVIILLLLLPYCCYYCYCSPFLLLSDSWQQCCNLVLVVVSVSCYTFRPSKSHKFLFEYNFKQPPPTNFVPTFWVLYRVYLVNFLVVYNKVITYYKQFIHFLIKTILIRKIITITIIFDYSNMSPFINQTPKYKPDVLSRRPRVY